MEFSSCYELTGRQVKKIQVHLQTQKNLDASQLFDIIAIIDAQMTEFKKWTDQGLLAR